MDRPEGVVEEEDEGVPDVVPDELQSQTCSPALLGCAETAPVNVGTSHAHRDRTSGRIAKLPLRVRILSRANGHLTASVCSTTPKYRGAAMTCQARLCPSGSALRRDGCILPHPKSAIFPKIGLAPLGPLGGRAKEESFRCRSSLSRTRAPMLVPHARSERPTGARPRPGSPAIRPGAVRAD